MWQEAQILELILFDCQGLRSAADVADVLDTLARTGLQPMTTATLYDTHLIPIDDVEAFVASRVSLETRPEIWRLARREWWGCLVCRDGQSHSCASLFVGRLDPDVWFISVAESRLFAQTSPLEAAGEEWGTLLERAGTALYEQCQPSIAWLAVVSADPDDSPELLEAFDAGDLVVGWRTWYGPSTVEAFGRERLLGLPNQTTPLADGGIAHKLDASLAALVAGEAAPYAAVTAYLRRVGLRSAWPEVY